MKPLYIALMAIFFMASCEESGKKTSKLLPKSIGNINSTQVVIENDLWNDDVGEKIREYLAAPVDGLPQEEPLFSITQMPPAAYDGFAKTYRSFMHVAIGDKDTVSIRKNPYARPQVGAFIISKTKEGLIRLIEEHHERIIAAFHASEIAERQRRIGVSLLKSDSLKGYFGVSLRMPSAYRVALATDEFYWLRKDLKDGGTTNIIVYEVPLDMIGKDSTVVNDIVTMRDSISGNRLPVEDDARFITEEAYSPFLFASEIDGKFAYETKGTWEIKGQYMAGPFLNYAIKDETNNRYLILEGFTYAPTARKRDLQFELEAILKSAKIQ